MAADAINVKREMLHGTGDFPVKKHCIIRAYITRHHELITCTRGEHCPLKFQLLPARFP